MMNQDEIKTEKQKKGGNRSRTQMAKAPEIDFYRKGVKIREQEQVYMNHETGEIHQRIKTTSYGQIKEPDFVKLYLDTMMSFQGINGIPTDVLIAMCKCIQGYNNDGKKPLYFQSTQLNKMQMGKMLDLSIAMINKYIKKMADAGILIKTEMQTVYIVNPWLLARGKWENIKHLQAHFNFKNGAWEIDSTLRPDKDENSDS